MTNLQPLLDQIPIRQNVISILIITGVLQGILMWAVILFRSNKDTQPIRFFGWLLLFTSLIGMDVYLCYTGLMKKVLWLNNTTEPLVLLIGPMVFLFVKSLLEKERIGWKSQSIHFIFPILYGFSQLGYYLQPDIVKLSFYLRAFFPERPLLEYPASSFLDFSNIFGNVFRIFLVGSILFYAILSARIIYKYRSKVSNLFLPDTRNDKYGFSKNVVWLLVVSLLVIFLVFINYKSDLGDHLIALVFAIGLLIVNFMMLSESRFFEKSWLSDKYDTSGLKKDHGKVIERIINFVETEKYYLQSSCSLKDLSTELAIPSNYLSQVINHQKGQNFNDFINQYRITEVKKRLVDEDYVHLNIAGIGESVGFKSKSAFYAAFKKYTEMTPAAYLKTMKSS